LNQRDLANDAYVFLAQACHQNPLRSFWYWGYPMALCGRCIGIYTGSLLGAGFSLISGRQVVALNVCLALMVFGFSDKLMEWAELDFYSGFMFNHLTLETSLRCFLGVMFGLGLSGVIGHLGSLLNKFFSKLEVHIE